MHIRLSFRSLDGPSSVWQCTCGFLALSFRSPPFRHSQHQPLQHVCRSSCRPQNGARNIALSSTSHQVERARLNGQLAFVYFSARFMHCRRGGPSRFSGCPGWKTPADLVCTSEPSCRSDGCRPPHFDVVTAVALVNCAFQQPCS